MEKRMYKIDHLKLLCLKVKKRKIENFICILTEDIK